MMKEAKKLENFCNNAKTFDQALECMARSIEFAEKWEVPQPQMLQSFPMTQFDEMVAIDRCFQKAVTIADFMKCQELQEDYMEEYGLDQSGFFKVLSQYGEFDGYLNVYDCYLKASTPKDVEKCNQLAEELSGSMSLAQITLNDQEKAAVGPYIAQALRFTAQAQAELKKSKAMINA
jgi:hypothetical protein